MYVPKIHVHTQADKNTIGYATFMWETMQLLASRPDALKLSVHCMGPTARDRLAKLPGVDAYHVPNIVSGEGLVGSTGHAVCVEHALRRTDDGDIHIIADSDTVVLAKGWDDYVRIKTLDQKVGTFGTTYEDIGGFTSGEGLVQTYKKCPNVVWMALSPLHRWRDLKAMPKKVKNILIENEGMSKIYGLPVGHEVLRDVAWQIPEYLSSRGISYEGWKQLKPTSPEAIILKGLIEYHEEYQVESGVPFVVHHRGSMRNVYRGTRVSNAFYGEVDKWLATESAGHARWVWMPNENNAAALESLQALATEAAARPPITDEEGPRTSTTRADVASEVLDGEFADGWAKVTVDGTCVMTRSSRPIAKTIDVSFTPDSTCKHVRIEGSVTDVNVTLPACERVPHTLIVRNLTAGWITLKSEGKRTVTVPADRNYQVVVDVDGVSLVG